MFLLALSSLTLAGRKFSNENSYIGQVMDYERYGDLLRSVLGKVDETFEGSPLKVCISSLTDITLTIF